MTIKEIKVETFKLIAQCDKCEVDLIFQNIIIDTYPPCYPHECPNCRECETLDNIYPFIITKEPE